MKSIAKQLFFYLAMCDLYRINKTPQKQNKKITL